MTSRLRLVRVSRRLLISLGTHVKSSSPVRVMILLPRTGEVVKFVARTFKDGKTITVRLPAPLARAYGIQPGDEVVVLGIEELESIESISNNNLATAQPLSVSRS
ncbi:hypothetical protein Vsou_13690 [Vulcanisaeta souniana JCM 11219]|nr:hypothetical protein Vsou_13690 [Vulcanisaeta souniana JCM 11219]